MDEKKKVIKEFCQLLLSLDYNSMISLIEREAMQ